ncbi:MAG: M23 family metallopeptidase [Acidobacteriota bacterium]
MAYGQSKAARWPRRILVLLVVAIAFFGGLSFWSGSAPGVELIPKLKGIGKRTPIEVKIDDVSHVQRVRIEVIQGADKIAVTEKEYIPSPNWAFWRGRRPETFTVDIGRDTVKGLRAGDAIVRATAERAGNLIRTADPTIAEVKLPVRLSPPVLSLLSTQHYTAQGGCEVVVYQVSQSERDGVSVGSWWFPGFPLPGAPDARTHFALFAVPYDHTTADEVHLVATDEVGNESSQSFVDQFKAKPIHTDTIPLDDAFLGRVVPAILAESPEVSDQGDLLKSYLEINRNLRKKNAATLKELAAKSERKFLWSEPFVPMKNAKITAAFADRRTYMYQTKPVDQQDHLGFDMASVEHDSILASNRGKVALARFFGIYGNAIVIDHGYGLMSLYGHLSSIEVKEGQMVERNQEIGRSGKTGLAGGDHLHFTLLLQGLPVNPVEWWDPHWIRDRIVRKLGAALPFTG